MTRRNKLQMALDFITFPLAEIIVHKIVWFYDKTFKTNFDVDSERGTDEEKAYFLPDIEIVERLTQAGFRNISKKFFLDPMGFTPSFCGLEGITG